MELRGFRCFPPEKNAVSIPLCPQIYLRGIVTTWAKGQFERCRPLRKLQYNSVEMPLSYGIPFSHLVDEWKQQKSSQNFFQGGLWVRVHESVGKLTFREPLPVIRLTRIVSNTFTVNPTKP